MTRGTSTLLDVARTLWDAGLTPMPRVIGYVEPTTIAETGEVYSLEWGEYKVKQPDWLTVERWFTQSDPDTVGLILLTGSHAHPRASHTAFLQILDIETADMFDAITEELHFSGHSAILHRCVIERTPSGGGHIGFGCTTIGSTQKLALARRREDRKILVELLQHQSCTIAPTSIRCKPEHPEGATYHVTHGDWAHLLEISPEQRQILLDVCRAFNEVPGKEAKETHGKPANGTRPGDMLNARADLDWWEALLTRHDWRDVSRPGLASRGITYWQRPGKSGREPSATYGATGQCLYVFSSNAQPFDPDTAYTPFAALALLDHDGDFKKAASVLAQLHGLDVAHTAAQDAQQRQNGHVHDAKSKSSSQVLPYSDYTNALALVREHGENLRYCYPWKSWLVWTGTHWQRDTSGAVMRMAKQTVKRLARHAEDLDDDKAKALMAHVKASLATAKLKAMIENAQSEEGIPVQPEAFDADRWLLNCTNGTLDLHTATLRPHQREDLQTTCLAVAYDPNAVCPIWDAFLHRIMDGNKNLSSFLQRAIGYALTGVIREHILLILWGSGRNGKSTFLNTVRSLLGPYGMKAPSELLMVSNNDRHPTERADLLGKRFVAAIETEQGRKLAEVFVKEATGGDSIRARRMREDFWEFQPTHKVFLATNHTPVISGTDNAIWERIKLVPFTVTIPLDERDTTLPDQLAAELPGILAWAVRGCLAWQREGLGEPDEVTTATARYRMDMDVLGQFIKDCCFEGPNYCTKADKLYDAYKGWGGEQAENQRTWGMALTDRGFERKRRTGGYYWWLGIGLKDTTQPESKRETSSSSSKTQVNQVNDSEPKNAINGHIQVRDRETGELGSLGSLGSLDADSATQAVEAQVVAGETSPHCPKGGAHNWLPVETGRLCSRCNAEET